ncbi:MAG TPA: hypothetical protein VJL54_01190 [Nitrososphaera sp.]|nr:hypothetical protein [Nitrososphaera sp.]
MRQGRTILFAGIVVAAAAMTWLVLSMSYGPPPQVTLVPEEQNNASENGQGATTFVSPHNILVDFSVYPENHANAEPIMVERGVIEIIPLVVEAPNDAEGTLQMQLTSWVGPEAGMIDPEELNAELGQTTVVLSRLDLAEGKVTKLTEDRGIRDAGTLMLDPPASVTPGEYSFILEVRQQQVAGEPVPTEVSGTMIYVTVI